MENRIFFVEDFIAFTIGMIIYLLGKHVNAGVSLLRNYNIPDAVTGGLLAALAGLIVYLVAGIELEYDLTTRDTFLVYFFTTLGLNARISDLLAGGRTLAILLALTLAYIVIQNIVGVAGALMSGQPLAIGLLVGSASLIGGHGTTIAWAPEIAKNHGVPQALEIGIASATLGLVVASLLGGVIANLLIRKKHVSGEECGETLLIGLPNESGETEKITHITILRVLLWTHVAIIIGFGLNEAIQKIGFRLPVFVTCLLAAIVLSNSLPRLLPKLPWPSGTKALAVVSDFSLGLFITMSLMSMKLWSIAGMAGSLVIILAMQVSVAILFIVILLYPLLGRTYLAVVLSAGFAGFSLGATPTAIANMTAVTKAHGPAPTAFIILPLVGAFFVDISNALVIQFFLSI